MPAYAGLNLRPYRPDELDRLLTVVGEWGSETDFCSYLHPGDMRHNMSNGLRGQDPSQYFFWHEDSNGRPVAVVMLYAPRFSGFAVMVAPSQRNVDLEAALLEWGADQTWQKVVAAGLEKTAVYSDIMDCDPIRREAALKEGFVISEQPFMFFTARSLLDPIPESVLPEGFTIRSVTGEHEADALGIVHSAAFNSSWSPGEYLHVMRSPAFEIDHELVVVAPGGQLAAFLVYWIDPISKCGLFEPVGCHRDFQRRGLTRALMAEGLRRMAAQGMTTAIVNHHHAERNPASSGLYASMGFRPRFGMFEAAQSRR